MTFEEKKQYLREAGWVKLVAELVSAGYKLEDAVDIVYDMKKMSRDEFASKYIK